MILTNKSRDFFFFFLQIHFSDECDKYKSKNAFLVLF